MQKKIVEFTNLLRKAGVRVSLAEAIDAFSAVDELSFADRELFRDALRTTMVKRSDDIPVYDRLFDLYWSGFHGALREELSQAVAAMGGNLDIDELMERLRDLIQNMDDIDISELARAMLAMDPNLLEQQIRDAAEGVGVDRIQNMLQIGFFSRRMTEQMDLDAAGGQLAELMKRLEEAGMDPDELEQLAKLLRALQDAVRSSVRRYVEQELDKQNQDYLERFRREQLQEKSFYSLTEDDIRKMREVVTRLAQKLKNVITIRRKRHPGPACVRVKR